MKKITLALVMLMFCGYLYSQRAVNIKPAGTAKMGSVMHKKSKATMDSVLFFPSMDIECSEEIVYYTYGAEYGYYTGNNSFGDKEVAQKYNWTGGGKITGALCLVASLTQTGTSAIKIYSVDNITGAPKDLLSTGATVKLDTFKTAMLHEFPLASPLSSPSQGFFVSLVLPTGAKDTLICFSTKDGCYVDSTLSWFKDKDDGWNMYSGELVGAKWDLVILPVVQLEVGMKERDNSGSVQMLPNPVSEKAIISYNINRNTSVKFIITDITGREVMVKEEGYHAAGFHHVMIDVSRLRKGIYYYTLKTDSGTVTKKMAVNN
jgi:hypothetical protein